MEKDEPGKTTLLDHFINENQPNYPAEVRDIVSRLNSIGKKTGAREHFFKDWEGAPGDGVCALFDDPDKNLRLYCVRFGSGVLIVGGGGPKPKSIKALQDDKKLTDENEIARMVSARVGVRIRGKEITWADDETELLGDFDFYEKEE